MSYIRKHNYRDIHELERKTKKYKRTILVLYLPALIGYMFVLNYYIDWISTIDIFAPKNILIIDKEVKDSIADDLPSLVQAGDLPFVESDSEASGVKPTPPATSIESRIIKICEEENFDNPDLLMRIARAESSLRPNAVNINKNGSRDRGIMQWNDKAHPDISDDCAFSVDCSVRLAVNKIKSGGISAWNSSRAKWDI